MFAHLTLAVRDVPATSQFFADTLGWKPIRRPGNIPIDADWLEMAPGQQLHLLRVDQFAPSPFEAEFGRHVALMYPGAEFAALKQRLVRCGAQLIDAIRPTPFERFFFRDPNGYVFEVIDREGYATE